MVALMRRRRLVVIAAFVASLALVGGALFVSVRDGSLAVVTFSAAPGGHISPDGQVTASVGSQIAVTVWSDDPSSQPWLMVDGHAVDTTPGPSGRAAYEVQVVGDETVNASFAQLASDVRVLDPVTTAAIASVAADGSEITFYSSTPLLNALAINDVLVNGTSWQRTTPLIVRVTAIDRSGNQVVVKTKPATLLDVFVSASVQLDESIHQSGEQPLADAGTGPIAIGPPVANAADDAPVSNHVGVEWSDDQGRKVSANANVSIRVPRVDFSLDIGLDGLLPVVHSFEATVTESVTVMASLKAQQGAELSREWFAYQHEFGPICPFPFVCVFPQIQVGVGASIEYAMAVSVEASGGASATVGVQWQNGWSAVQQLDGQGLDNPNAGPSPAPKVEGKATIYPLVRATANIEGLCGPYFEIRPGQLDLTADASANPWWELDAGIGVAGGVQCIFGDPYEMASAEPFKVTLATANPPQFPGPIPSRSPTPEPSPTQSGTFAPDSPTRFGATDTVTMLADGRVLIVGGDGNGGLTCATSRCHWPTNVASLYDPTTGTFSYSGDHMRALREEHTATLLADGRVLLAGGDWGGPSAEVYDPKADTFTWAAGPMTVHRRDHTATRLGDGRVLIVGGIAGLYLPTAELYDPTTGKFSQTGSMATARAGQTATLLSDGRVLIAGGENQYGEVSSAELYDPTTGKFTPTGPMGDAREYDTATLLSDGRVLIAGGYDGFKLLDTAELYDPTTGTFSPGSLMTTVRVGHTATLLADGQVLIAGGYDGGKALASAELYDPKTGDFSVTGSMITARTNHDATRLADGRILINRGDDARVGFGSSTLVFSSELYNPTTGTFSPTG